MDKIATYETTMTTSALRRVRFNCREGTMDICAVSAGIEGNEYRLDGLSIHGWAIDVGAYIGTVSIPLAIDNPDLRVLAIEPVPENGDLLERNAKLNGVSDRVILVRAMACKPGVEKGLIRYGWTHYNDPLSPKDSVSDEYLFQHRFIGEAFRDVGQPQFRLEVPAVSLDSLLSTYGIQNVALLKIDCEGCEWEFLDTPAISQVELIIGEFHCEFAGKSQLYRPRKDLAELLSKTHTVKFWDDNVVVGLFSAERI